MDSIIQTMPQLAGYVPAIVGLALLCLVVLVQSFLAGALGLGRGEELPGLPLKGDHAKFSFRVLRTHANSVENFSVMVATTFLAILAGVGASLVNWLVGLHLLFRLVFWAVYYSGIGKVAGGPRTLAFVGGFFMNLILAVLTLFALAF